MSIKLSLQALAFGAVLVCGAVQAEAAILTFATSLSGPAEEPPNLSPGTGSAAVVIDTVLREMSLDVTFSGLLAITTAAHIHGPTPLPFQGNAGVMTTTPTFTGFPLGVTSGTYSQDFDLKLSSSYNPAFVTQQGGIENAYTAFLMSLLDGRAYLNIHTDLFRGGEIRGFLAQTPLPGALPLFASVLGVGGWLGYRRKRAQREVLAA